MTIVSTVRLQTDRLPKGEIGKKFEDLINSYQGVRDRGVNLSAYATPTIFPPRDYDENTSLPATWQSTVADGVNNLASKFTLSTLNPGSTPLEFAIRGDLLQQLHQTNPALVPLVRGVLAGEARVAHEQLMATNLWTSLFTVLALSACTGNGMLYQDDKLNFTAYNMWDYHVHRTMSGDAFAINVRDWYQIENMPASWLKAIKTALEPEQLKKIEEDGDPIPVYGFVKWDGKVWRVTREAAGVVVERDVVYNGTSTGTTPYAPFVWSHMPGAHYGRGLLEEVFGAIRVHDGQSRSLTEGAAAASRVIPFLAPDAITRPEDLNGDNGKIVVGRADDLTFSGYANQLNLNWALTHNEAVRTQLDRIFLNDVALFPTGDRVTATQILKMQEALRERHGGVAAHLVRLQKPVFERSVFTMQKLGYVSKEIKFMGAKDPFQLRTKVSADPFGRTDEFQRYMTYTQYAMQLGEEGAKRLDIDNMLMDVARVLGLDARTVVKSNEQLQQNMQQEAQAEQQQAASQKAIEVQGNVAEQQATSAL